MNEANILFGPPGTGKTTTLLSVVNMKIKDGIPPDQICFISFTRKAANEAKWRAMERFKLTDEQLPWFRTLHSLAFQQMGMNKNSVMGLGDWIKLSQILNLTITYKTLSDDGTFAGQTLGDRLFFAENMARARMIPLKEYWESLPNEDILWHELERLAAALEQYKIAHNKVDFTDIIHMFIESGQAPGCQVLIVDEAQDLSPLQWRMVERLRELIPESYVAGDDDQAIFRWAGADVDHLIKLPGQQTVLGKSFRVPKKVQEVANTITKRIKYRVEKEWDARDEDGVVERVTDVSQIDMSHGTWLLLGRNNFLLDKYIDHCMRSGYVFDCPRDTTVKRESFIAIRDWEKLRNGQEIFASSVKLIYDLISVRVGITYGFKGKVDTLPDRRLMTMTELREQFGLCTTKPWNEALDKMPDMERAYFVEAIRKGEKFDAEPRIKISTIHGAKGGEAQNVVIQTDMAYRTYKEMELSPDDEHRVWYVAVTRAKHRLVIVSPQTNLSYDI